MASSGNSPSKLFKYANKFCPNHRTRKRDGSLHTLCQEHRDRINSAQRVYASKRSKRSRELRRERVFESKPHLRHQNSHSSTASTASTSSFSAGFAIGDILGDDNDKTFDELHIPIVYEL
ncbi:unnamed protein product [Aphanomyces euteiches]